MDSLDWQPVTWFIFHTIALNYNEEYKEQYITFFNTFKTIIPCKTCRNNYIMHLKKENMSIEENIEPNKIFNWTVDLHNKVNKINKKTEWSYEKAKNYYKVNNFNNQNFKIFILEYIKNNFKKDFLKTNELIKMIKTLPYFHPNIDKKNKLINFKNKFQLERKNIRQWLITFLLLLKN
jgi:hypothetical protein